MTEEKKPALIEYKTIKPFIDAAALGLAVGGPSAFSGHFWEGFVFGSSVSLMVFWSRGNLSAPKTVKKGKRSDDYVTVNSSRGSRHVRRFEQVAPGYVTRQSLWSDVFGLFKSKPRPRVTHQPPVQAVRPASLDQFYFLSPDDSGIMRQLLSPDVRNFLRTAWLHKNHGRGLGRRRWDTRNERSWPEWYPGPFWYEAMMQLIRQTEAGLQRQLIDRLDNNWLMMRRPPTGPNSTYEHILYWYVEEKKYEQ